VLLMLGAFQGQQWSQFSVLSAPQIDPQNTSCKPWFWKHDQKETHGSALGYLTVTQRVPRPKRALVLGGLCPVSWVAWFGCAGLCPPGSRCWRLGSHGSGVGGAGGRWGSRGSHWMLPSGEDKVFSWKRSKNEYDP
jgi:hypothetical protein